MPVCKPTDDLSLIAAHLEARLEWATRHHMSAGTQAVSEANTSLALWLVHSGTVSILFSGADQASTEKVVLQSGDAILMGTDRQRTISATRGADWLSVGLTLRLFSSDTSLCLFPRVVRWHPPEKEQTQLQVLLELAAAHCHEVPAAHNHRNLSFRFCVPNTSVERWVTDGVARCLTAHVWDECQQQGTHIARPFGSSTSSATPGWLMIVLLHVTNHAATTTVSQMAQIAGVSQSQFNRMFRQHTGCTPLTQLNRARLQNACRLLLTTDRTVEFVAQSVGFDSLSYFTRLFAKEYKETPARYRQIQRSLRI